MEIQTDIPMSYRVEVSGWDAFECFFVEKTMLEWGHDPHREIRLRARIQQGTVVFVRLLEPIDDGANFPVAYQAVKVMPKEANGWARIGLAQLRPRESYKEKARAVCDTTIPVA